MEQPQKKNSLKSLELRCDLILFIEVRRSLEPYSKLSSMSVKKKMFPLNFNEKSKRYVYYLLSHQILELYPQSILINKILFLQKKKLFATNFKHMENKQTIQIKYEDT